MDWINANAGLLIVITLAFMVAILLVVIILLVKINIIKRGIANSSLVISAGINYDSDNLAEALSITIFNNNYRDILLHDFGFTYKDQNISLIAEYTERRVGKGRACVPARSSLSYKVNPERVEKFVLGHNFNARKVGKILLYVCDSVGNKVLVKDRPLSRLFSSRQKARLKLARVKIHEDSVKAYMAENEGNRPFSDKVWRFFHKSDIKIPRLLKESASFIGDKTVTPENASRSRYNPAPIQNSDPEIETSATDEEDFANSRTRTDTKDMKVTFIDLDMPLKGKNLDSKEKKKP